MLDHELVLVCEHKRVDLKDFNISVNKKIVKMLYNECQLGFLALDAEVFGDVEQLLHRNAFIVVYMELVQVVRIIVFNGVYRDLGNV